MKRIPKEENPRKIEFYIKNYPELSKEEQIKKHKKYIKSQNFRYIEYYQDKYPELSLEEQEKLRQKALLSEKPYNIEYWIKRNKDKSLDEINILFQNFINEDKIKKLSPYKIEYYRYYHPDWSEEKCLEETKKYRQSKCPQNINYWINKYPDLSIEECENLRKNDIKNKRLNYKSSIGYWEENYPNWTPEQREEQRKYYGAISNQRNIKYWEYHYPNLSHEEHLKMLQNAKDRYAVNQPRNFGHKNGMHKSNTTQEKRNSCCPWHEDFYKKRYPNLSEEEREKLRQDLINRTQNNITYNTTLEYYLNKGMCKEEAEEALKERQATCRLEKYIKRYGQEEGYKKWEERQCKWKSSLQQSFIQNRGQKYIVQSIFAEEAILNICNQLNIEVPKKELFLPSENNRRGYLYDFNYKNKIIEFNGDYWHCNPKTWKSKDFHNTMKITAQEKWDNDKIKFENAINKGYQVLVIWESEYKENKDATIKKCIEFLTND